MKTYPNLFFAALFCSALLTGAFLPAEAKTINIAPIAPCEPPEQLTLQGRALIDGKPIRLPPERTSL